MGLNQKRDKTLGSARRNNRKQNGGIHVSVEAPVCAYQAYMDQWEAAINTWREGVGRVKSTISSTANSSESSREVDHRDKWNTCAFLEGLLGCPYRRDLWRLISAVTVY